MSENGYTEETYTAPGRILNFGGQGAHCCCTRAFFSFLLLPHERYRRNAPSWVRFESGRVTPRPRRPRETQHSCSLNRESGDLVIRMSTCNHANSSALLDAHQASLNYPPTTSQKNPKMIITLLPMNALMLGLVRVGSCPQRFRDG